ncbi:NAD(P)H-dependent glycerol-3-phosphate dehydrogenase [Nakamurella multipartita]|jgi:glycerol-3-phosphate dehydrogenase (NAD(P)+)|uniref:Glycerol-3-phosphate dehydrogenase [NAD(P)+] n=1 Tax=Nakamurella multipartita (strain ATCC 700099 / DSM 44233 / CIP 104796 / JCM 9543 / NBRC 105858 / Y-104) TaxID=479431 RepID=C8XJV8_NAKMY|nr:NAD(P)H-dependent glycerol-3-phosphate dehydrogenase [Nakamurella multipartita]ACV76641.1 Glycerol-3-phosphate dehydrogenase (NAD(P)(+)) [Nakamurella multipartita DSM 44233]HOZ56840.1 NAD(P)H-dependent glycerol-3-phosphate dehydrogenase [Nakamurella multipartita]
MTAVRALRRQPKVAVIGSGSWGTSVASIIARHSPTVIWGRSAEVVDQINTGHTNERYLPGYALTPSLTATTDLARAVEPADILIMAVPSHGFRGALDDLAPFLRPWAPVVSLVKGLEQGSRKRMTEIVDEVLPGHPAGVLAGPNIAREVAAGYAAAAVIAMPDQHLAAQLGELFRTKYFRIYSSSDVTGVEIAGSLKNVFAIAVGMGDGVGSGDNTRAMVITRSLREMTKLGTAVGGQSETMTGLAGMGDLVVTCTSKFSRNRHVGEEIGRGVPVPQILAGMKQVAEGVKTASVVMEMAAEYGVDMPIAREVDAVVNHGSTPERAYRGLLNEAPGHEVHGAGW